MTTPLTPEQLAIIAAYQTLSQALAGPITPGAPPSPIPTRAQPTITDVQPPTANADPPETVKITGTNLGDTPTVRVNVHVGKEQALDVLADTTGTQVTFSTQNLTPGTTARITVTTGLGWVLSPTDYTIS
jgi:hypothetical protein